MRAFIAWLARTSLVQKLLGLAVKDMSKGDQ